MGYTKGERILYCGEKRWYVLTRDKPNRPDKIIGAFDKKEDASLFLAAPRSYEWLIKVISQGILSPSRNKELYNEALAIRAEAEEK